MGKCIWGKRNPKNPIADILLYRDKGDADPYVAMVERQVAHWSKMLREHVMPQEELEIGERLCKTGETAKAPYI